MKISAALSKEAFLKKMEDLVRAITQQDNPQPIDKKSMGIRTDIWTAPTLYHDEKEFFTTDMGVTPYYGLGGGFLLSAANTEGNLYADEPLLEDVYSLMILRVPEKQTGEEDRDPNLVASAFFWNNPSANFLVRKIVLSGPHDINTPEDLESIFVRVRYFVKAITHMEA